MCKRIMDKINYLFRDYIRSYEIKHITKDQKNLHFERIGTFGESRLDGWTNKLILGDNLMALELLLQDPAMKGKVRLIYIDPPYSTNQEFKIGDERTATVSSSSEDKVAYRDKVLGADYLKFLHDRLVLLREILADDGSIYVHVDVKVGHYVKVLMDKIFGEENFINHIVRIKCNPKNFSRHGYGNIHDMILFYSKSKKYVWNDSREAFSEDEIRRLFPKVDKSGRRYTTTPLHAPGETKSGVTGLPWRGIRPPKGRHWRYPPEELERLDKEGLIEWSSSGNPRKIIYADEIVQKGKKRQDVWEFKDPPYPIYPTEKNLEMLKVIVQASSNPDDIVLDCFAGSGTTLVAAEILGRRWVGIDNSEVAIEIIQKRLLTMNKVTAADCSTVKGELPASPQDGFLGSP
jgi:adenine-specific DNA-methyltransferase